MKDIDEYNYLTTKQAAQLISVHESSVKRWCKDGQMVHDITDGGHRRIHIDDLLVFARGKELNCSLANFAGDSSKVWALFRNAQSKGNYEGLVHQAYTWLREFQMLMFKKLIIFCLEQDLSFSDVFDNLIASILKRIGDDWHSNQLDIGTEHYMTAVVRDLIHELRAAPSAARQATADPKIKQLPQTSRTAVVGCNEGNSHDISAHAIRIILEQEGWHVIFLGADVPASEFAKMQVRHNAQLLCISFVTANMIATAARTKEILAKFYDPSHPYHLALGGQTFPEDASISLAPAPFTSLQIYQSTGDFNGWLQHHQTSIAA